MRKSTPQGQDSEDTCVQSRMRRNIHSKDHCYLVGGWWRFVAAADVAVTRNKSLHS